MLLRSISVAKIIVVSLRFLSLGLGYQQLTHTTKSLDELAVIYEDENNAMIAVTEKDNIHLYEDFYEEMNNEIIIGDSMDMLFFGPPRSFLRIDAETLLHILKNTVKHKIPIARTLLAWDIITDGKTSAYLQGREFFAFGTLLNVIPEEDLYFANMGDKTVTKYFAENYILKSRKMGIILSAYRRYYGEGWFVNGSFITEYGYLLCGVPYYDLEKIPPKTVTTIPVETFEKIIKCSKNQSQTIYNIATHPDAYGSPYKWTSHEILRLGPLLIRIPDKDINLIHLEAVQAISANVIKLMDQSKLSCFSNEQVLRMNPTARRIHILRMQLNLAFDIDQLGNFNKSYTLRTSQLCIIIIIGMPTLYVRQLLNNYGHLK